MIFGVGTDIYLIARMRPLANNPQDAFFRKAFTDNEQKQAWSRPDSMLYFSTHFAGKEAVYKAISQCNCDFRPGDIEILDSEDGRPEVSIFGETQKTLKKYSPIRIFLSLSFDGNYAIALALVESDK